MLSSVSPLNGWMLDTAVELDTHHLGFAGSYLRASTERRQVIAAFCASPSWKESRANAEVAEFLLRAGHKMILREGYGSVPNGFRGALARASSQPHAARFYMQLHALLAGANNGKAVSTISQLPKFDLNILDIISILPPAVCSPPVVRAMCDVSYTEQALKLIDLLVTHGVDRGALHTAIAKVETRAQLMSLWKRWALRCAFPAQPVAASSGYQPIATADELRSMARRYRNCSMRYLTEVLNGFGAFGEFLPSKGRRGMIVHMQLRSEGWQIKDFFLRDNMSPSAARRQGASEFLVAAGVKPRRVREKQTGEWDSLERLTSFAMFDLDELD